MRSNIHLQQAYIKLYRHLRDFIWDFSVVELIADLEVESFTTFPDVDKLRKTTNKLDIEFRDLLKDEDNEDFKTTWNSFKDIVNNNSEYYHKIHEVKEVIPV